MGKDLVGWKLPIASLLILGMARLTLSDVEEMRGDVREGKDKEDVPLEALKYLGRFGHLRPPEGPFSLVDRWVNNYNLSSRRPVLTLPITLSAYYSLSLYEQRTLSIIHIFPSFETGLRSFQSWVGINTSGALDKYVTFHIFCFLCVHCS